MDRVNEDMAKSYTAPCATTWFKVTNNKKPTNDEYRKKVVEFLRHFEYVLSKIYPPGSQTEYLRDCTKEGLQKSILGINGENNKEVDRHYTYYTSYI